MSEYSVFHGLVGVAATMLGVLLHWSAERTTLVIFALGVAHELFDGDLWRKADGAPYEGVKDALSFLFPGPFVYLMLHACR